MRVQRTFLITFLYIYVHFSRGFTREGNICYRPRANHHFKCNFGDNKQRLVCANGFKVNWRTNETEGVRVLILCSWPKATFDPQEILRRFTNLRNLTIANSNLTRLSTAFPNEIQYLEEINITNTKLRTLPKDAFSNLPALKCLDLRNNALEEISITAFRSPALEHIHLAGNPLRCTEDTAWILDSGVGSAARKVVDKDKLLCATPYDGRPLVPIVEIIVTLKEECKQTVCDCELIYVVGSAGTLTQKQLIAFTSVNCSHRGLTEMPGFLPANTTTLRLTGNKIKDLSPLARNSAYKSLLDLYIDNNLIESIVRLEGSDWLERFRLLNLRGNKLTDLPTYALENALLHNGNIAGLYLGNNSWTCDCHFTPSFQDLLIRHSNLIKDINDIRCAFTDDSDNSNKQIRDLTRTEICISPDDDSYLQPLDIVSIVLASFLFLVLSNLLYDCWYFKKTGKVPRVVNRISWRW